MLVVTITFALAGVGAYFVGRYISKALDDWHPFAEAERDIPPHESPDEAEGVRVDTPKPQAADPSPVEFLAIGPLYANGVVRYGDTQSPWVMIPGSYSHGKPLWYRLTSEYPSEDCPQCIAHTCVQRIIRCDAWSRDLHTHGEETTLS